MNANFKLRAHPGRAIGAGILNGLFLLALPLTVIHFLLEILRSGGAGILGGRAQWSAADVASIIAWFESLQRVILIVGGAATALAALTALWPKGALRRMIFGLGRQGARFAWLALILEGGLWSFAFVFPGNIFRGVFGSGGGSSTRVQLGLDLSAVFTLMYAALSFTALYLIVEFLVHRRELMAAKVMAAYPGGYPPPPAPEEYVDPYQGPPQGP